MAQYKEIARIFSSSGGSRISEKEYIFLYTTEGNLISKHWTGTTYGDEEFIAEEIREKSSALYIDTPTGARIVAISSDNLLRIYSSKEGEWDLVEGVPKVKVHSNSKLAGGFGKDGISVFYQDEAGHLAYLDGANKTHTLPGAAIAGTPLSVGHSEEHTQLFYHATDNRLHYLVDSTKTWTDSIVADGTIDKSLKRLMVTTNVDTKGFEAFALTEDNAIFFIQSKTSSSEELKEQVGSLKGDQFVASASAECCRCWCPPPCYPRYGCYGWGWCC